MPESFVKVSGIDPRYTHHCEPDRTPDGRFAVKVVIERADGAAPMNIRVTPNAPTFETAREAADAAYAEGERWVERHG
ncbi:MULTISPECIES: hypothetical protein [unclassified Rhizobacter]|uniref:hypothetical protein n=1 Tax=unclassified Rhizobacter TaxID=2640088 RepID=UPI0006F2B83E|nr:MULTISPECIES: hypothetical protein [unclassified Rhizobacter]KQU69125.1 hypothetical protein ASC88_28745 [Rhizobacter sp. Root29]KQW03929.1 hypothetical protein ASC98_26915 [Rhizobacter sp. Root1238]KRB21570.1 hypothetical protein ASE08_21600 [Rhizobacter sp. Root16D2]